MKGQSVHYYGLIGIVTGFAMSFNAIGMHIFNTDTTLDDNRDRFQQTARQESVRGLLAPLLCAGITTYNALRNSGARGGDLVTIQGMGGLGHLGIQYANKLGFKTVALSRGKDKESLARELGAHIYIDTAATNVGEELTKLGGARVISHRPQLQGHY